MEDNLYQQRNVMICDDDANILEMVHRVLTTAGWDSSHIQTFTSGKAMLSELQKAAVLPTIIIMDIQLADCNGIEIVEQLQLEQQDIAIIYITGFTEYIETACRTDFCYYLVKPLTPERIYAAIEKARLRCHTAQISNERLVLQTGHAPVSLKKAEILCISSLKRKVIVTVSSAGVIENQELYGKLDDIAPLLGSRFCRCHKSFFVNIEWVSYIKDRDFVLRNGSLVPISKARFAEAKKQYIDYLSEMV